MTCSGFRGEEQVRPPAFWGTIPQSAVCISVAMDDTAQLIHDIYEVAIDPTCWRPLLDKLLTRLGGPGEGRAVLFSDDEDNTLPLTYAQVRFNDDDEIAYQQHYAPLNPWTRRMMALKRTWA